MKILQPSKHNIIGQIKESEDFYVVNLLSGHADILSKEEAEGISKNQPVDIEGAVKKGYIIDADEEKANFKSAYLDFQDDQEDEEVQLFFIPSYQCNFDCFYCYQTEYLTQEAGLTTERIDAFFAYIKQELSDRKTYITLFGGEPLLSSNANKEIIKYFIEKANKHKQEISIVTNGYSLDEFLPILEKASIREIQVTLDGTKEMHDKRRPLRGGQSTFDKIVDGIDKALAAKFSINLRMVLDKENIKELAKLAKLAIEKGWTKNYLFKTQLGRNYELHTCQSKQSSLYNRLNLYEDIYDLIRQHPEILEFHKPAYSISKFLFENGDLPAPLFDACPGTKAEWAFDFTGNIYSCTATVGKPGEELGTYYPTITKNEEEIESWQERDILSIEKCDSCNLRLACGGGCASVAKNTNGSIHSTDCRPIKELIGLGMGVYK